VPLGSSGRGSAAASVVVPDALADIVPIERSGSGIRIIARDKEGAEAAGLVKIDLLGNRSLAVVRDAIANCGAVRGDEGFAFVDPLTGTQTGVSSPAR
jgi:DNA polymerase III alpha subunit